MKSFTIFLLLCSLNIFLCNEPGGVKVALNQKFIKNMIKSMESEIRKRIDNIQIPGDKHLRNGVFGIPNFNSNMISLEFENNEIINLKISNCAPYFKGSYYYKIIFWIHNNFHASFNNFKLNFRFKVKSRNVAGGYAPDAEIISGPDVDFKLDISTDGFLHGLISWVINKCQGLVKPIVLPILKSHAREQMLKIIRKFETKIKVGNGFWLDFTLKTPIKTKNRFLELNSIANFYSENPETQKKDRYPQNNLPSINLIGSQFQLYVSEYSINTAIFTFLTEKSKPLSFRVGTKILNSMLPGIVDKYGEKQATVTLIQSPNSNVKITDQYFGINVPGTLSIKVDGITNEILNCNLDLSLKVDIIVNYQNMQNYVTGNIKELSAKVKEVKVNEVSKSDISFIESGFKFIDITVIKLLNEFIKNNFLFSVPPIMGVTLINIRFIHKNGYFEVNYDIK